MMTIMCDGHSAFLDRDTTYRTGLLLDGPWTDGETMMESSKDRKEMDISQAFTVKSL